MMSLTKRPLDKILNFMGPIVLLVSGLFWLYCWQHLLLFEANIYFIALLVFGVVLQCIYMRLLDAVNAKPLNCMVLAVVLFPLFALFGQMGGLKLLSMFASEESLYLYPPFEALYFFSSMLMCFGILRGYLNKLGNTVASYGLIVAELLLVITCGIIAFIFSP